MKLLTKIAVNPIVVEAFQYKGDGFELLDWAGGVSEGNGTSLFIELGQGVKIKLDNGQELEVEIGDWIVCSVDGKFEICKSFAFDILYKLAPEEEV